jgi:DNA helicase-2/ATP-dependent DNA helicase PcrA
MVRDHQPVGELLGKILEQIDYHAYLDDGTEEGIERWRNVLEFKGVADAEEGMILAEFLERVALVSDVDDLEESSNVPTLLTLHASKGLEFPVVFIVGMEDGILPHSRTFEDMEEMAEERRLFYVGITRAKDRLFLTHAFRRSLYGMSDVAQASRFLADIPTELVEGGNQLVRQLEAKQQMTTWSWDRSRPLQSPAGSRGTDAGYSGARSSRPRPKPAPAPPQSARNLPKPRHLDDEEEPQRARLTTSQFKIGQRVRHSKFGEGVVIETKLTGNDEEVTVAFPGTGIKRLAASFARLDKLE